MSRFVKKLHREGPAVLFHPPAHRRLIRPTGWFTAVIILLVSLGFVYTAFHHHHDFTAHPDCPVCILAGQAPAIKAPLEVPGPERTPKPFFQETGNRSVPQFFPLSTFPRAPPV